MTEPIPRDAGNWATKVDRLRVADEQRAHAFNVEGRRVAGPHQGFGRLWDRTFRIALGAAVAPDALVKDWRARFGQFWPKAGTFHHSIRAIEAGDVAPLTAGGGVVATGILVIYADETSFTFMTPEAHIFAGMITFSAHLDDEGGTVAEIRMLLRTADPSWEAVWPIVRTMEAAFWRGTLTNLAAANGVTGVPVTETTVCVDRARLWRNWRNLFHNGALATLAHVAARPFRRSATMGDAR